MRGAGSLWPQKLLVEQLDKLFSFYVGFLSSYQHHRSGPGSYDGGNAWKALPEAACSAYFRMDNYGSCLADINTSQLAVRLLRPVWVLG